jgi:hypothetical protein
LTDADGRHAQRARPRPVEPIARRRVTFWTCVIFGAAYGSMVAIRALSDGHFGSWLSFAIGIVLLPIIASPLEWFVHRFVYHEAKLRPLATIFVVHTVHHFIYFPTWRYVTGGPARRLALRRRTPAAHESVRRNAAVRGAHFLWYMAIGLVVVWVPAWAITRRPAFVAGLIISTAIVSNLFIVVHDTIHRPGSHKVVEAQPWFSFLDRHHYIHHVALGANLNFLLPLADLCFGTLRTVLTPDEIATHGTLVSAKRAVVGKGERAVPSK